MNSGDLLLSSAAGFLLTNSLHACQDGSAEESDTCSVCSHCLGIAHLVQRCSEPCVALKWLLYDRNVLLVYLQQRGDVALRILYHETACTN